MRNRSNTDIYLYRKTQHEETKKYIDILKEK
jgi:hypothetical protein